MFKDRFLVLDEYDAKKGTWLYRVSIVKGSSSTQGTGFNNRISDARTISVGKEGVSTVIARLLHFRSRNILTASVRFVQQNPFEKGVI